MRDPRRSFGTVGDAVVAVLAEAASDMRVREIHCAVERVLGGSVSLYSVADYLQRRAKGARPLFRRTRYGCYELLK